jgi:hypothetical protein
MGAIAAIGTWFAGKSIPWNWIGILAGVLVLVGIYLHVESLKNDLVQARSDLAHERVLKQEAIARADDILTQHSLQVERIEALEDRRKTLAGEVMALRKTIQELDIEGDIEGDNADKADEAVARLNARNRDLNRLLERASGQNVVRSNQGAGSKASPPGARSALQRALQALW